MNKTKETFDNYVIESIIANNQFGITNVVSVEVIRTMNFEGQEYLKIVELIETNNIETLINLPESDIRTSGYLSIIRFRDQNGKEYIATVYDSDELWQDPQLGDIFPPVNQVAR